MDKLDTSKKRHHTHTKNYGKHTGTYKEKTKEENRHDTNLPYYDDTPVLKSMPQEKEVEEHKANTPEDIILSHIPENHPLRIIKNKIDHEKELINDRLNYADETQKPDSQGVYYPKHTAISRFINHPKRPNPLLYDQYGRIYGYMPNSQLLRNIQMLPFFNENIDSLLWVALSKPKEYNIRGTIYRSKGLYIGESNRFPMVGSIVNLYKDLPPTGPPSYTIKIIMYPEPIRRTSRSASLVVRVLI